MKVHSTVLRHYRTEDGAKHWVRIRRLRCKKCRKIHRQLPDTILPYKHYQAQVIEEVLDDAKPEPTGPESSTLYRWKKWFSSAKGLLESRLVAMQTVKTGLFQSLLRDETLLAERRKKGGGWLADIMRHTINAGYPACIPSLRID